MKQLTTAEVNLLYAQASDKTQELAIELRRRALELAAFAKDVAGLHGLAPGIVSHSLTIAKTLTTEATYIERSLKLKYGVAEAEEKLAA